MPVEQDQPSSRNEPVMPIAIIGMSGRYPGDAANPEKLWEMISNARSAMTEVPADRFNINAFYHPYNERSGSINVRGGHYMNHVEVDAFDAPFFSITPNEALAMDPQQRMALECTYEAMENAGLRMEDLVGSDTSVYVGSFSKDYSEMMAADQENLPLYFGVGTGTAILSNRVSWFFDLKGPSISIDTACSSALVALHLGCQSLRTGESKTSIVGGVNFMLVPGVMTAMTSLGFLSPDSICHSFDEKANGYARGEGASFVILKPLDLALRDHDVIRGVIRNTGVNQDGNTPGITVPSADSQEALIRKCYEDAGLPLDQTQYVEAHGTGTQAGDPQETSALSRTLGVSRAVGDPLLIGSIKTNIGHLEGASGLAQVTKAIFALEKAEIPPNLWYEKPNSRIPMDDWNLKVVEKLTPWPSDGPRRISINSFGYGGTNAHCILDDAYHYLKVRGLKGNHATIPSSETASPSSSTGSSTDSAIALTPAHDLQTSILNMDIGNGAGFFDATSHPTLPKLFVWSSNEQTGVDRTAALHKEYLAKKLDAIKSDREEGSFLEKLSRTLSSRRSIFPWKNWGVASSGKELVQVLESPTSKAKRSAKAPKLGFIFTGQGAQWYAMGRELRAYPIFEQSLLEADAHLKSLGCTWSLFEEFRMDEISSKINSPQFSQPICTALQVALVDLLKSWGVSPEAVAGHSSGEIAAAYAKGAFSREDAWSIAYHRGRLSEGLKELAPNLQGGMLATGLDAVAVQPFIDALTEGSATVACKNSPSSTTVSGDFIAIKALEISLTAAGHFARLLKVETAYHSAHMEVIADLYLDSIKDLQTLPGSGKVKMFSSVTGTLIENEDLGAAYWVKNMVSEVNFVAAVQSLCRHSPGKRRTTKPFVDVLVELGPHSALQGPLKQILKAEGGKMAEISSLSVLSRGVDACVSSLSIMGSLFQLGYPVNIAAANRELTTLGKDGFLVDIPPFAWNRNNKYWGESQVSKNYRFRDHPRSDLLGATIPQGNSIEPLFRNIIKLNEMPWVECHKVQGTIIYPAAGMLVAAIQAAAQRASKDREVEGYELRDVIIGKAIVIPADDNGTETMLSLRPWRAGSQDLASTWDEFRLMSRQLDSPEWILNCTGLVRVKYVADPEESNLNSAGIFADEEALAAADYRERFDRIEANCHKTVDAEAHYEALSTIGLNFSGPFKSLVSVKRGHFQSRCDVQIPDTKAMMPQNFEFEHVIHPSTLDCIIQIGLAGATPANEELTVGLIPTFLEHFYISSRIPSQAGALLHGVAAIENEGFEHAQGSFIVYDDKWDRPVVTFQGIKSTALRHGELGFAQAASMRKLIASFHWQEDISKLDSASLTKTCALALQPLPPVNASIIAELEHAAFIYMRRVLDTCSHAEVKSFKPHFQKFYQLMQNTKDQVIERKIPHQGPQEDWLHVSPEDEAALLKRVAESSADGAVMCEHGENLVAIMRGEVLAIEVLMKNNHLNNFYQYGVGCAQTYAQLAAYVDLLAHKNPTMKILEIGAGTGGATLPVLEALGGQNGTSPRMSNYTFTDISTGFFDKAHEKFKSWLPWMTFAALDIERDPTTQTFKEGEYDLIIAANVLHATPSMDQTLNFTKKLLKPNGKLVLSEITNPLQRIHMIVGSFDGWWAGEKDGREWGPTMTEATWDEVLKRNAFSGVDLAMQDIQEPRDHFYSVMVSTALSETPASPAQNHILIVEPENPSPQLQSFIDQAVAKLRAKGTILSSVHLKDTAALDVSETSCIFALDCDDDGSLLPSINEVDFECLKKLIMRSVNSTWITRGATINSELPKNNLMTGMARCIRAENPSVALLTVDLDFNNPIDTPQTVEKFVQIYDSGLNAHSEVRPDWEYAIRDDKILIQRILLEKGMNDLLSSFHVQPKPELTTFKQEGRPLALQVETAGRLDSLQFGDDTQYDTPLSADGVEIEVKGVGLNFKDVMIAMGQLEELALGLDCSGIVSRIGSEVKNFKVGDRVMTWTVGAFCNFARSPESMCVLIPEELTFGVAASMPLIFSTAWYALSNTANLKKGETVLIHSAAGGVGQAAIMLSKHIGAEIFATVSSDAKKKLIMDRYGIQEDHIFNSRDDSFVQGIMRMTKKKGVDVVLNSLAGELLRKTWTCTAWFGRFVEMGQKDIENNTGLDMAPFLRNISFHSINLVGLLKHALPTCSQVFQEVMAMLSQGITKPVEPMTFMPFSQIEEGFRLMQIGKHMGKIILEAHDDDLVPVVPPKYKSMKFRPDVTYVLSGGLGGLGRSLAEWMIRQGARNIVFLSRSGAQKPEARATLDSLTKAGANVCAYACDVSDADEVKRVVAECEKSFPPIKGCIQGAMVLKDAIYENMTHEQYLGAVRPKVQGSWNLHEYLPKDMDFFVMLSSSAGIAGSRGQGNYAAGNSFQDALANHRRGLGLAAGAIDLGMILDIGYVAETTNKEVAENTKKWSFAGIREKEVHALVQSVIEGQSAPGQKIPPQLITGLGTGGMANLAGFKIPWWFEDAKFAHIKDVDTHQVTMETEEDTVQLQILLSQTTTMEGASDIVSMALLRKLAKSLMVDVEDIESTRPISRYGVDSLLAVEIRAWIFTEIQADISVFQLLSNVPISQLVRTIVGKSKCVPAAVLAEI